MKYRKGRKGSLYSHTYCSLPYYGTNMYVGMPLGRDVAVESC